MAEQLVEAMTAPWEPEQYRDTYRDDLLRLIDEKVKTGAVSEVAAPRAEAAEGKVVDIMALLKRSMEQRQVSGDADGAPARGGARRGAATGDDEAGGPAGAAAAAAGATAGSEKSASAGKSGRGGTRKAG